jgi:hypothetical protein
VWWKQIIDLARGFGGRQGFLRGTTADPLHIPTPGAQPFVESSLRATLLVNVMSILLSINRGRHVVGFDYEAVHSIEAYPHVVLSRHWYRIDRRQDGRGRDKKINHPLTNNRKEYVAELAHALQDSRR